MDTNEELHLLELFASRDRTLNDAIDEAMRSMLAERKELNENPEKFYNA